MLGGHDRPVLTLQRLDRNIVIDRDDENVGFLRSGVQIADVADVQDVEAAVGERNRPSCRALTANTSGEHLSAEDLTHARAPFQNLTSRHVSVRPPTPSLCPASSPRCRRRNSPDARLLRTSPPTPGPAPSSPSRYRPRR